MTETDQSLERFGVLIDTYGSRLDRWPSESQAWARSLLRSSLEAAGLLRDATALELVLQQAPTVATDRADALADKIVTAAVLSGRGVSQPLAERRLSHGPTRSVIQLPSQPPSATPALIAIAPRRRRSMPQSWRAAASLAASLLLGIYIGTYDLVPSTLNTLVDGVSKEQDMELFVTSLGGDGLTPSLDEDHL